MTRMYLYKRTGELAATEDDQSRHSANSWQSKSDPSHSEPTLSDVTRLFDHRIRFVAHGDGQRIVEVNARPHPHHRVDTYYLSWDATAVDLWRTVHKYLTETAGLTVPDDTRQRLRQAVTATAGDQDHLPTEEEVTARLLDRGTGTFTVPDVTTAITTAVTLAHTHDADIGVVDATPTRDDTEYDLTLVVDDLQDQITPTEHTEDLIDEIQATLESELIDDQREQIKTAISTLHTETSLTKQEIRELVVDQAPTSSSVTTKLFNRTTGSPTTPGDQSPHRPETQSESITDSFQQSPSHTPEQWTDTAGGPTPMRGAIVVFILGLLLVGLIVFIWSATFGIDIPVPIPDPTTWIDQLISQATRILSLIASLTTV